MKTGNKQSQVPHGSNFYPLLMIFLLIGCSGGDSENLNTDNSSSGTSSISEPSGPSGSSGSTSTDTPTGDHLISRQHSSNGTSFYHNSFVVTEDAQWIGLWNYEDASDTTAIYATNSLDTGWSDPIAISTSGAISPAIEANSKTVVTAWVQRNIEGVGIVGAEINTRFYKNGSWSEALLLGQEAGVNNQHYALGEIDLAPLPNNEFALVWSDRRSGDSDDRRLFSESTNNNWSTPITLAANGSHVGYNSLLADTAGNLSYFYIAKPPGTGETEPSAIWIRERHSDIWSENVRIDDLPTLPVGFSLVGQTRPVLGQSDNGRQILAWEVTLRDSNQTIVQGIAVRTRAGIGLSWSTPNLTLNPDGGKGNIKVAITDDDKAAVVWTSKAADGAEDTLSLLRHKPTVGWLPTTESVFDLAAVGIGSEYIKTAEWDNYHLSIQNNNIWLHSIVDAQKKDPPLSFYSTILQAKIGMSENPLIESSLTANDLSASLIACASSPSVRRCSRHISVYRYTTDPNMLMTEQIWVANMP